MAEHLVLEKKTDRYFANPFLTARAASIVYPMTENFKKHVKTFALNLMSEWEKSIKADTDFLPPGRHHDCSVYTGLAGYALLYLDAGNMLDDAGYREQAFFMVEKCCMHMDGRQLSFLIGDGGPLALSAVCAHIMRQPEKEHHFIHRLEKFYESCRALTDSNADMPDELLYGRAGCLYSLLFIKQYIDRRVNEKLVVAIVQAIMDSGKRLAAQLRANGHSSPPLMFEWHGKKYIGAAHGLAGIIYLLLQVREHLTSDDLNHFIRPTLDFLLETRFHSGNFPSSLENESDRLVQWCHGAPGFVHCLLTASQVFDSELYLAAAKRCAEVTWERGVLTKGFSLCHGMAGNAFAILRLYQHTKDPLYLHRACKFAEIIMDAAPHEFRTPDRPLSLYEGTAGVIHFLLSLLNPDKARFPGYEVGHYTFSP